MNEFQNELQEIKIDPNKIFLKIWTSPREVFKFINDNKYQKHVNFLLMAFGIAKAIEKYAKKIHLGDSFSWVAIGMIILGGIFIYVLFYIYAELISWTGKWINGKGDSKSIFRILSYAMIPSILGYAFLIPLIAVYGIDFQKPGNVSGYVVFFYDSIIVVSSIWTMVLFIIGVSEVQKFSIWKSIGNLILPAIFLVSIILFLSIFFVHMS